MAEKYSRQIVFESISNFRDLGGYSTRKGDTVAWRRLFRSGDLRHMTQGDFKKLKEKIRLATVIDLRSAREIERQGIGLLSEAAIRYHSVPFIAGANLAEDERLFRQCRNMGEFYLHIVRHKDFGSQIVAALEVIAEPKNQPLIFHCAIGKDRTGILAAILLSVLGVADEDIISDYSLSAPYIEALRKQINSDPKMEKVANPLPGYFWEATPDSMALFLTTLRKEYGSISGYLESVDMEPSLIERLEKALLT
jgi:protein-tyrosine phosphatase